MSIEQQVPTVPRNEFVQSLERGLSVIRAFSADRPRLTLSDAAKATGLTRATARRVLHTLEQLGYVRCDDRYFELTPRVLDLGYAYVSSFRLPDLAQPAMEQLSAQVHESVSMSVLDGSDVVYVARVPASRLMTISLQVGSRLPALTTSMGRVLLAELAEKDLRAFIAFHPPKPRTTRTAIDAESLTNAIREVRQQGWCLLDQELEDGVRSVAAPIRDRMGRAVAAINVSTHAGRVTLRDLRATILPELLATATELTERLKHR